MSMMAKIVLPLLGASLFYIVALCWIGSLDVAVAGFILREGDFSSSTTVTDYIDCAYPSEALSFLFMTGTPSSAPNHGQVNVSGNCLHGKPFQLLGADNSTVLSFSTSFTFALVPNNSSAGESIDGLAFIIVPTLSRPPGHSDSGYLGLLNAATNDRPSSHTFAVEFDTFPNSEFNDSLHDHVGIDINSLTSFNSSPAGYYHTDCTGDDFNPIILKNETIIQAWIDYNASTQHVSVTVSSSPGFKPQTPLLDTKVDLSGLILEQMYVGFSSSTGAVGGYSYVFDWSFNVNGSEDPIYPERSGPWKDFHRRCPTTSSKPSLSLILGIASPMALFAIVAMAVLGVCYVRKSRGIGGKQFQDLIELDRADYRPKKFSYKALSAATEGFNASRVLGKGGFGSVYKGILPAGGDGSGNPLVVAVKRMVPQSTKGIQEFVAEMEIIGRLRHRNLVQLLGWCREKDELLLVYEYMINGSLDQWLFGSDDRERNLSWSQRLCILCGVANSLVYLHDEWKQVVVHRDVKASNVMLDSGFNAKLGDFGLARLLEHKLQEPESFNVAGTLGYLSPEARSQGRFTDKSDVYSFGVLVLEVSSGRRPVDVKRPSEEIFLLMWVWDLYEQGRVLDAVDDNLIEGTSYFDAKSKAEISSVVQIGLLCCHPDANIRPTMAQVVQMLKGEIPLLPVASFPSRSLSRAQSFELAFGDDYQWADHSVELGMIENSEEIKLIPQSPNSSTLSESDQPINSFSFVLSNSGSAPCKQQTKVQKT